MFKTYSLQSSLVPLVGKYTNNVTYVKFPKIEDSLRKWYTNGDSNFINNVPTATTSGEDNIDKNTNNSTTNENKRKNEIKYCEHLLWSDNFMAVVNNIDRIVKSLYGWTESTIITCSDYDKYFVHWSIDTRKLQIKKCKYYIALLLRINLAIKHRKIEKNIGGDEENYNAMLVSSRISKPKSNNTNNNNRNRNNKNDDDDDDDISDCTDDNYQEVLKMFLPTMVEGEEEDDGKEEEENNTNVATGNSSKSFNDHNNTTPITSPANTAFVQRSFSERRHRLSKLDHFINKHEELMKWFYKHKDNMKLFNVTTSSVVTGNDGINDDDDNDLILPESLIKIIPLSIPLRRFNADIPDIKVKIEKLEWIEKSSTSVLKLSNNNILKKHMLRERLKQERYHSIHVEKRKDITNENKLFIKNELNNLMDIDIESPHNLYLKPFPEVAQFFMSINLSDIGYIDDKRIKKQKKEIIDTFNQILFSDTAQDIINNDIVNNTNKHELFQIRYTLLDLLNLNTKREQDKIIDKKNLGDEAYFGSKHSIILALLYCLYHCEKRMYWIDTSKTVDYNSHSSFSSFSTKNKNNNGETTAASDENDESEEESEEEEENNVIEEVFKKPGTSSNSSTFPKFSSKNKVKYFLMEKYNFALHMHRMSFLSIFRWIANKRQHGFSVNDDTIPFTLLYPLDDGSFSLNTMTEYCLPDLKSMILKVRFWSETCDENLALVRMWEKSLPYRSHCRSIAQMLCETCRHDNVFYSFIKRLLFLSLTGGYIRRWPVVGVGSGNNHELQEDCRFWTQTQRPHFRSIYFISEQLIDKSKQHVLSFLHCQGFFTKYLILENLISNIYELPHLRENQPFINWPAFEREADFAINTYRVHLDGTCSFYSTKASDEDDVNVEEEEKIVRIVSPESLFCQDIISRWIYEDKLEHVKKMGSIYAYIKGNFVTTILDQMNTIQEDLIVIEMDLREDLHSLKRIKELAANLKYQQQQKEEKEEEEKEDKSSKPTAIIAISAANVSQNFIKNKIKTTIINTMQTEKDILNFINNDMTKEESDKLIDKNTIERFIQIKKSKLSTFKDDYSLSPEIKTMIWHFVMGMTSIHNVNQEEEEEEVVNDDKKEGEEDSSRENVEIIKNILGDVGLRIYAQLLKLYSDKVSNKRLYKLLCTLRSQTFARLYFMLRCYEFALSIQLIRSNQPIITKIEHAMINYRYKMMKDEELPIYACYVYITLCCKRIATHIDPDCYGHKTIVYDSTRKTYVCGKKQSKKTSQNNMDHYFDSDSSSSDDEDENNGANDLSLALASTKITKKSASTVNNANDKNQQSIQKKRTFSSKKQPPPQKRRRTIKKPTTATTTPSFVLKNSSIKVKRKIARRKKRDREQLKCHETPVLAINLKNYRLSFGNGEKNKKYYQFCPGCGNLHEYSSSLESGIGGYMCYDCSKNTVERMNIYACLYCGVEITDEQMKECYRYPLVNLNNSEQTIQFHHYCSHHQIKTTYGKSVLFFDRHRYLLGKKSKIMSEISIGRTPAEKRMIDQRNKKASRAWNYRK